MKRFQVIHEALKDAIFSEKTTDIILKSCKLRDVPGNKIPVVGQLTTRVLLGYLRPELFAQEIQKETGMDEQKAAYIAHDLDTEIFSEVRLELKKLYPPTLQTPTVQSQGFAPLGNRGNRVSIGNPVSTVSTTPPPRYVVPIPEKFMRHEAQSMTRGIQDLRFKIQEKTPAQAAAPLAAQQQPELKTPQESPQETEKGKFHASSFMPQESKPAPAPQTPAIPQSVPVAPALKAKEAHEAGETHATLAMKPVVPLPTFIQSKFKNGEREA